MKILLVNKFHYMKGGSERYYFTIAEAFKSMGHEVIFFAMQDKENNIPCAQEKYFVSNSAVHGGFKSKLNMVLHIAYSKEAYKKMTALLNAEKPDLVILNLVHKQITCSVIDAVKDFNKDIPVFWTMHDLIAVCPSYTMLDGNGHICEKCLHGDFSNCKKNKCIKGSSLMSRLSTYEANYIKKKKWYDKVDLFICPSQFYADKLKEGNFTKSPVVCMRNPLPLDTEYAVSESDGGYILYFGRLSAEKGVKNLIDASVKAGVKLIILGTGPQEGELKEYAKDLNGIEFKGFQSGTALTEYIKGARCVALPSEWYENGPYSAMEAMALGKPLIVSDKGGLPELVEDGKNGYVYKSKEELVEALKKITTLPEKEYKSMSEESVERAKKLFDPVKYADGIIKYFNGCKK